LQEGGITLSHGKSLVGVSKERGSGSGSRGESDETAVVCLSRGAEYREAVENHRDVGFDMWVGRIVLGNPSFALAWFDLEAEVGKSGEPQGPDVVKEGRVAGYDNIVHISEDGD
jgi:hypothetical protein